MQILVADTFEALVSVLDRILKANGYSVISAADGIQAVEFSKAFAPQVALLDSEMTDSTGVAAYRSVKQVNPEVKVILMMNLHRSYIPAVMENVAAILKKPFRIVKLLEILDRMKSPTLQ